MKISFDISQTGSGKAGCGFFAHAMIQTLLELAPKHHYSLLPGFGDFYFDALMPIGNPYPGRDVHYGPRHLSRDAARYELAACVKGLDLSRACLHDGEHRKALGCRSATDMQNQ